MAVNKGPSIKSGRKLFSSRREEIIEKQYNEIKHLESKYRNLYEGAPDMYRTINTHGTILDCNRAYVIGLGYASKKEVVGHSIFEHTAEESLDAMRESFEQWRRTGEVRNKEVWFRSKNGTSFPVLISATNLYDDDGNLIGSNSAIIDATEIYRARKQLEDSNQQLREAQRLKDEFISIASHELRTPIQPLLNYAELCERGLIESKEALKIIKTQAVRMKELANNILDVSRIESGSINYNMEKTKINEVILEVVDTSKYAQLVNYGKARRQITIETQLAEDIEISIDRMRIAQALTNILQNAIKFTDEGTIRIVTSFSADKKTFEIKIIDSGPGIPNDLLPKLFGKFVTKTYGNNANKHGTGLGLFITKSIIQAHGGEIIAENNQNKKGASFIVRLPLR